MGSSRIFSRLRPSPGTVIACIALVVACTGSATAATLITGAQIKNNSVTTKDVKNKSLKAGDFKPGQLPRGPAGAQGATGAQGAQGVQGAPGLSDLEEVSGGTAYNSESPKDATISCPAGKTAIDASVNIVGGKSGSSPTALQEVVLDTLGTYGGQGWVDAYETDGYAGDWSADLTVLCARVAP